MENQKKKTSKYVGVTWHPENKKWIATAFEYGEWVYYGSSDCEETMGGLAYHRRYLYKERALRKLVYDLYVKGEEWKQIPWYPLYYVSNRGRVISLIGNPKLLKESFRGPGYPGVAVKIDTKRKNFYVHRLVAQAFIPNPNNYPQVNHKNSIRNDNRVHNLEWCTCKQNINHAIKKGRMLVGEKNGNCNGTNLSQNKLTKEQVSVIKYRLMNESYWGLNSDLAEEYGVVQHTISGIKTGTHWWFVEPAKPSL